MKTSCKRIVSFILVLMTIVGCCVPAMAADTTCKHDDPELQELFASQEATCKDPGYKQYKCNMEGCGVVYLDESTIVPATGVHTWKKVETVTNCVGTPKYFDGAAQTPENIEYYVIGKITEKCSACGTVNPDYSAELTRKPGEAMKHNYVYKAADKKANYDCSKDGGVRICTICNVTTLITTGSIVGDSKKYHVLATRDNGHGGTQTYCLVCSKASPVEHAFVGTVTKKVDECKDGEMTFKCVCGVSFTEVIVSTNAHKGPTVAVADQTVNCTQDGWTDRYDCTYCGKIASTSSYDKAPGHQWQSVAAQAATCTAKGWNAHKQCSVCNATQGKVESDKLPHVMEVKAWLNNTRANCSTGASGKADLKCANCSYEQKNQNISSTSEFAHNYHVTQSVAPTCTSYGYDVNVCVWCQKNKSDFVDKSAHNWENVTATSFTTPTCTKDAVLADCKKCKDCGTYNDPSKVVPAHGHKKSTVLPNRDATCGKYGYYYCLNEDCDVYGDITGIDDASYDYNTSKNNPTNGVKGCIIVNKKAHNWNAKGDVVEAPTCVSKGTYKKKCSVCGAQHATETVAGSAVDMTEAGHVTLITELNAATCITTGTRTKFCPTCKTSIVENLEMIPGTVRTQNDASKFPSYDTVKKEYLEANAGAKFDVTSQEVLDWMLQKGYEGYEVAASCTTKGSRIYICKVDYNEKHHTHIEKTTNGVTETGLPSLDGYVHVAGAGKTDIWEKTENYKAPTHTAAGKTATYKCTGCGTKIGGTTIKNIHDALKDVKVDTAKTATFYLQLTTSALETGAADSKATWSVVDAMPSSGTYAEFAYVAPSTAKCHDGANTDVKGNKAYVYCTASTCYNDGQTHGVAGFTKAVYTYNTSTKKYVASSLSAVTTKVEWVWVTVNYAKHCPVFNCEKCINNYDTTKRPNADYVGAYCDGDGYNQARMCSKCKVFDYKLVTGYTGKDASKNSAWLENTTGHVNVKDIPTVTLTCYQDGYTGGKKCQACGEVTVQPTKTPKLDHADFATWDDAHKDTITGTQGCTTAGYTFTACKYCLDVAQNLKTETIKSVFGVLENTSPALGHVSATAKDSKGNAIEIIEGWFCSNPLLAKKEGGYKKWSGTDYTCSRCYLGRKGQAADGEVLTGDANPFTPKHETVTIGASKDATCVATGYKISICDFCQTNKTTIITADLKAPDADKYHKFGDVQTIEASYTTASKRIKVCELCGLEKVISEANDKKVAFKIKLEVIDALGNVTTKGFVKSGIIGVRVILVTQDDQTFPITSAQVTFPISENLIFRDVKYADGFTTDTAAIDANIKNDNCVFLLNMLNDPDGNVLVTEVSGEFTLGEVYFVISDTANNKAPVLNAASDFKSEKGTVVANTGLMGVLIDTADFAGTSVLDDNYDATAKKYDAYGIANETTKHYEVLIGLLGDANGDKVVNNQDAQRLTNLIRTGEYDATLDIDKDGKLTMTDLIFLQANIVGSKSDMDFHNSGLTSDQAWSVKK